MLRLSLFLLINTIVLINSQPQTMDIGQVVKVTWNNVGKYSEFTLTSKIVGSNGWVGIGFGRGMNFMNTIICKNTPTIKTVEHYYNEWFSSKPFTYPGVGLSNVSVSFENDTLTCKFNRENRNQAKNYYQISETGSSVANFVAAYGDVTSTGDIIKHKLHAKSYSPARFSVDLVFRPTMQMPNLPSWMTAKGQDIPNVPNLEKPTIPMGLMSLVSLLTPEMISKVTDMINPQSLSTFQAFLTPENIGMFSSFLSNPSFVAGLDKINTKEGVAGLNSVINPELLDRIKPFLTPNVVNMVKPYLSVDNIGIIQNFLNKDNLGLNLVHFSNILAKPENMANLKQGLGHLSHIVGTPNYISYIQSFMTPSYMAMFQNFLTNPEYINTFIWPMYNVNWMNVLSQWNKEYEMAPIAETQLKLRYYNELGYLQNYFTSMGASYINTFVSLLGQNLFSKMYNCPEFIHFCNYCIRNAY